MKLNKWDVYKLITNAPKDCWTQDDYNKGYIKDINKINTPKYRFTVILDSLWNFPNNEMILVAQLNSKRPTNKSIPAIPVGRMINPIKNVKIHGYSIPINVRLALSSEFKDKETVAIGYQGYVDIQQRNKFNIVLAQTLKFNKRDKLIEDIKNGNYSFLNDKQQWDLVSTKQFNVHELSSKSNAFNKFEKTLTKSQKEEPLVDLIPFSPPNTSSDDNEPQD